MEPMIVTPVMAHRWMLRQTWHQHGGQSDHIQCYASRMRSGSWVCTGRSPITFNDRGQLIDGRCRIAAIVLADIPVLLHVIGWHYGPFPHEEEEIA